MKVKKSLIYTILVLLLMNNYQSYSNPVFHETKGDSVVAKNNVISLNLTQLCVGELRLSFENQRNGKRYNVYGIGLIGGGSIIPSNYYYGFDLFYGNKYFIKRNIYWSPEIFLKYVKDINLTLNGYIYDRYYYWPASGSQTNQFFKYRNKYVFGIKALLGIQNTSKHMTVTDFYWGFGIRFRKYEYSDTVKITDLPNNMTNFIFISIHLGFSIGYNLRKK